VFAQPKEVSGNRVAGEPIGLERGFAVLEEILTLAPFTIGRIEERGGNLRYRGHNKARILPRRGDFCFPDHVTRLRPTLRALGKGVEVLDGGPPAPTARAGFRQGRRPLTEEAGMLRQAKDGGDPAPFSLCFFQPPQESRDGKRGIAAPHHLHVRTPLLEAADAPSQYPPRAPRRRGIARAQHRAHELPALPVTDEERMLPGLIVVAVQAGELRLAVGGIVSGGDIQGSVASFHLRGVPLCCSPEREVEETRHDELQGEPI
jgi:hypothetical protein